MGIKLKDFTNTIKRSVANAGSRLKGPTRSMVDYMSKGTAVTGSVMGRKNYDTAYKTAKDLIKKGNYKGAQSYITEQDKKIKKQQSR